MKAVFTCGGTGGHINPALAVARVLLERRPDSEILFVGAEDGMENRIVPREGFRLETLKISNYQRSFTPKAVWHNVTTLLQGCALHPPRTEKGGPHHPRFPAGRHPRHGRLCQLSDAPRGRAPRHPHGRARVQCRAGPRHKNGGR